MENLKKGDIVEISSKNTTYTIRATTGNRYIVNEKPRNGIVKVDLAMFLRLNDVKKIGESQMQYEESNCYKLKQAIKKTGISSEKLSLATTLGKTKSHFYSYTKKSRLTDRGDISEDRLNELLTDLAFAEREVLGVGAKTVEESSDAEIQMIDLADSAKEKPKSINHLFIGAIIIFVFLILLILNNYFQVV